MKMAPSFVDPRRYEGWANYQTWNVSLWLSNDFDLYQQVVKFRTTHPNCTYEDFIERGLRSDHCCLTPDGVSWSDPTLDHDELDPFIQELGA